MKKLSYIVLLCLCCSFVLSCQTFLDDLVNQISSRRTSNSNLKNNYEEQPIEKLWFSVVKKGDINSVKRILDEKKVDVNLQEENGRTGLIWAAHNGHISVVKELVKRDAKINMQDNDLRTALIWATINAHIRIIKYLLGINVSLAPKDINGDSAIDWANKKNLARILRLFRGRTFKAIERLKRIVNNNDKYRDVIPLLEKAGNDINGQINSKKNTLLHYVSFKGYPDLAKVLVRNGANIDAVNQKGGNALMIAAFNGHKEIVQFLIQNSIKLNVRDKNQYNAVMYACSSLVKKHGSAILDILIDAGEEYKIKGTDLRTPLILASLEGQFEMVKKLIKKKVNINDHDDKKETALSYAMQRKNEISIKYQAHPNTEDQQAMINYQNIIDHLKQNGAQTPEQLGIK